MPYFIRIGRIEENVSKVGSRGYLLYRTGSYVVHRWGAIEVIGRRFYWCNWAAVRKHGTKIRKFKSIQAARDYLRKEKLRRCSDREYDERYHCLPPGAIIRARYPPPS